LCLKRSNQNALSTYIEKVFSKQFPQPLENITFKDWFKYFDDIADKSSPKMAVTAMRRLKTMLSWCICRGLVDGSPVMYLHIKDVGKKSSIGRRVLLLTEIVKTWLEIKIEIEIEIEIERA
jgi:hypothetical protein